jgi:hypothetical protein
MAQGSRLTGPALVALLAVGATAVVSAHDIPNDVTIQTFIRPEGRRLHVLVRAPLLAMRDLDYPRRGASPLGLLDLARADATLRDAATLWISDFLDVYENDAKLPYPRSLQCAHHSSRTSPFARTRQRSPTSPVRRCRQTPSSSGRKDCWM